VNARTNRKILRRLAGPSRPPAAILRIPGAAAGERAFGCVVAEPGLQFRDVPELGDAWDEDMQGPPWTSRAPPFLRTAPRRDRVPEGCRHPDRGSQAAASERLDRGHVCPVVKDLTGAGVKHIEQALGDFWVFVWVKLANHNERHGPGASLKFP
jgi:hypothetical protein